MNNNWVYFQAEVAFLLREKKKKKTQTMKKFAEVVFSVGVWPRAQNHPDSALNLDLHP